MLGKLFESLVHRPAPEAQAAPRPKRVLNVGGGSRDIPIPPHYAGWTQHLLDIDPRGNPDVIADARDLTRQPGATYDAIYCAHNLEHYLHHDARRVLLGFMHLLKEDGFAEIKVPDILAVMKKAVANGLDLDDELEVTPIGPIQVRDVLWGYGKEIESTGKDFYAHKTGFSPKSLTAFLENAGFAEVFLDATGAERLEVAAIAFKRSGPNPYKALFGLA